MRDGRLEQIMRKWNVWNDDQPRLYAELTAAGTTSAAAAGASAPASPHVLETTLRYLPSLLRAAVITLVLSCLSMAMAVGVRDAAGHRAGLRQHDRAARC